MTTAEPIIRLSSFAVVLVFMVTWELLVPRRPQSITRLLRWPNNFGLVILNTVVVHLLFPIAAVGVAFLAQTKGWGFFDGEHRRLSDRITAYALYTDPPLGRVGMTDAEVRRSGRRVLVGKLAMENVARAKEKGETEGFMKMFIDADTKEILGASFLGTAGDEVIHCVLDVMYAKAPYTVIERAVHIHPTVAEFIPGLLQDLAPLTA